MSPHRMDIPTLGHSRALRGEWDMVNPPWLRGPSSALQQRRMNQTLPPLPSRLLTELFSSSSPPSMERHKQAWFGEEDLAAPRAWPAPNRAFSPSLPLSPELTPQPLTEGLCTEGLPGLVPLTAQLPLPHQLPELSAWQPRDNGPGKCISLQLLGSWDGHFHPQEPWEKQGSADRSRRWGILTLRLWI